MAARKCRFQLCIERFQIVRRLFLRLRNFVIPAAPQPKLRTVTARRCTISCGFGASEPIPFLGADSIFSSRCGAISRRLLSAVSLSRRDPGDRNVSVQKIEDRLGGLRQDGGENKYRTTAPLWQKFVERLGSYATLPNPKSFPQVFEGIFSSKESLALTLLFQYITSISKTSTFILQSLSPNWARARPPRIGGGLKSSENVTLIPFCRKTKRKKRRLFWQPVGDQTKA